MFSNAQKNLSLRKEINLGIRNKIASSQVENDIEWNKNGRGYKNVLILPQEDNNAKSFSIEFKLTGQNPQPLLEFKTHSIFIKDKKVHLNGHELNSHLLLPRIKYNLTVGKHEIVLSIGNNVIEPRGNFPEEQQPVPNAPQGMIFPGVFNIVLSNRIMIEPWTPRRLFVFICGKLNTNMSFSSGDILEVFNKDKGIIRVGNNKILFNLNEPYKYNTFKDPITKSFMIDYFRVCIVNMFTMSKEEIYKDVRKIMESDFVGKNPLSRTLIIEFQG
tara:strand:- start:64 stop:882 length:819 start_codon:yes stop_codon:yes gene_type:complete